MSDSEGLDFSRFTKDRILPVVDTVTAQKRRSLVFSLAAALGTFLLCAGGAYLYLLPYKSLMQTHDMAYWPLIVLAPLSLSMIVFCLLYIIKLRNVVKGFRSSLISRMAEFIDPGLVHTTDGGPSSADLERLPLSLLEGAAVAGRDQFKGVIDGTAIRIFDVHVGKGGDKKAIQTGLYFQAAFTRRFAAAVVVTPADADGDAVKAKLVAEGAAAPGGAARFEDAVRGRRVFTSPGNGDFAGRLLSGEVLDHLESLRRERNTEFYMACRDGDLRIAMLTKTTRQELPGGVDGFDFGHCREFCLDATLCLEIARQFAGREDVWAPESTGQA